MDPRRNHLLSRRHFCLCCMTGATFAATVVGSLPARPLQRRAGSVHSSPKPCQIWVPSLSHT
jgi:hypothetical protein